MTGASAPSSLHAAELSSAAWLLASWWSRPVASERRAWDEAWPDADQVAAAVGADPASVEELAARAGEADAETLLEEYERLFVGPGHAPCSPYEALWRGDTPRRERGTLMSGATTQVVQLYRSLELGIRSDVGELPDHVAVECEALAHALELATPQSLQVARALVGEHLALWLPALCDAVESESREPFYRALATLTRAWTAALAASLE